MRTPREILLRRHQAVESKLDRIRSEVLATELSRDKSVAREVLNQGSSSPALRAPSPPPGER
ncbi:MAG TPA: hypothetical protein VJW76_13910, partial [Verrucomicrobiae bacterium]|nr:hypothetical protein [Verrucomicrobiae bacterium]